MDKKKEGEKKGTLKTPSQLPVYGFVIASLSLISLMLAAKGTQLGLWHFRTGFSILEYGAYSGLGAALISLIGLAMNFKHDHRRLFYTGVAGLLIGLLTVGIPWSYWKIAKSVPPIHDISTDTDNPPMFVSVVSLRKGATNSLEYGGEEIAKLQKSAYPDIVPAVVLVSKEEAIQRASGLAREMGWEIVDIDPEAGRIEATDTTTWFGFKDDIVIQISPQNEGSLLNIRSVSRVGKSDVGTNAMRIRKFLSQF